MSPAEHSPHHVPSSAEPQGGARHGDQGSNRTLAAAWLERPVVNFSLLRQRLVCLQNSHIERTYHTTSDLSQPHQRAINLRVMNQQELWGTFPCPWLGKSWWRPRLPTSKQRDLSNGHDQLTRPNLPFTRGEVRRETSELSGEYFFLLIKVIVLF